MKKVNLKELAEQMDFMLDEWSYYLDKSTGEIISIDDRYLGIAEDEDEESAHNLAEWEQNEVKQAVDIINRWQDMIHFPDKRELGEYEMMEEFSENFADAHIRDCLCIAIDGSGAFRRFKNTISRFGIEEQWYAHKDQAMLEFAKQWCEENDIPYYVEEEK